MNCGGREGRIEGWGSRADAKNKGHTGVLVWRAAWAEAGRGRYGGEGRKGDLIALAVLVQL